MKRKNEQRTNGRHPVRNTGAAVVGAVQGLKEGLQEEHLVDESVRAIHNLGDISRAVRREGRVQWDSPEIRKLRGEVDRGTDMAISKTRETAADATLVVRERGKKLTGPMKKTTQNMQEAAREGLHRAQAVATTARRARHAPGQIKHDLVAAKDSYKESLTMSLAMYGIIAVFGTAAFVLFTGGLVVTFNLLLGVPTGWFATFGLYTLIGVGTYFLGRDRRSEKREEARKHVKDVRSEVRYVARPVKEAFTQNHGVRT